MALLSLVFLGVHIVTAVVDPFTALGPIAALVPFASSYRPLWVGLGVVALDLGVALVLTSEFRRHIGARAWRAIHWAAYATWPLVVLHGIGAGTDTRTAWMIAIDALCVGVVAGAVAWRIVVRRPGAVPAAPRGGADSAGIAGPTGTARRPVGAG